MKPNEVNSDNAQHLLDTVYNYNVLVPAPSLAMTTSITNADGKRLQRRRAIFKVGDHVRMSKYRMAFEKSYTPNYTTEVFTIRKIQYNTDPITYLLKDNWNVDILGSVYAEELQPVKYPNVYLIEKIIARRANGDVRVKWLGFGNEHNSWISESSIY